MQKIIEQELSGSEESAKEKAQYTWAKDEIAWVFCIAFRDVFKVQFTGKHWLIGNKWRWEKIYEYKYLDSSGKHDLETKGYHNGMSHDSEDDFYSEKQEAVDRGIKFITKLKNRALKEYEEDLKKLTEYQNKN